MRTWIEAAVLVIALQLTLAGCGPGEGQDEPEDVSLPDGTRWATGAGGALYQTANIQSPSKLNTQLDRFYAAPANWHAVHNAVYREIDPDTLPCATFMTNALELAGVVAFPATHGATITPLKYPVQPTSAGVIPAVSGGLKGLFQVRYNTNGLSAYLMDRQVWRLVWSPDDLLPGDVIFVRPGEDWRHPEHTLMFHGWNQQSKGDAWVVDNEAERFCERGSHEFVQFCGPNGQGREYCCAAPGLHMHKRNLKHLTWLAGDDYQPMWFALRGP